MRGERQRDRAKLPTLYGELETLAVARKGLSLLVPKDVVPAVPLFKGSGDLGFSRWATALSKRMWGGIALAGCSQPRGYDSEGKNSLSTYSWQWEKGTSSYP